LCLNKKYIFLFNLFFIQLGKFDASKAVSKYDFNTFTKHDVYNNKSIVTKPTKLYNIWILYKIFYI
jgi:hypothetical protein